MKRISCDVARDLMTLCTGGMASADSRELLNEHLAGCEGCSAEYRRLNQEVDMPVNMPLQNESRNAFMKFRIRLRRQRIAAVCIGALITIVAMVCGFMVYEHVGAVHDFFSPHVAVVIPEAVYDDGWQKLETDGGMLEFDSVFWNMEVVCDANSDGPVELRFLDENGELCLDGIKLEPGTGMQLDGLVRNKKYQVEYRADGKFFCLNFN